MINSVNLAAATKLASKLTPEVNTDCANQWHT